MTVKINNAEELREFLYDLPDGYQDAVDEYVASALANSDLTKAISAEVAKGMADFEKRQGVNRLPMDGDASVPAGKAVDGVFKRPGAFYKAIWHKEIERSGGAVLKDMSIGTGSDGGFLVPETMRAELLKLALEAAIVRPRARVIPMDSLSVPFPVVKDTTHASSVYGGIVAYWTDENAAMTETNPKFGRINLTAHKLAGYVEVPNELIQDSIVSLEAFLNQAFPEAIAYYEDAAFIDGTGAGQPLGILNGNCLISVTKETNQAATTIVWENIVKMYSRMLPSSLNRAVWLAHIDTFPQLATMSLQVGTGGSAIWLNNGTQGPPMTILGRPVIFTEKAQTLGTAGDIYFADFGYYLVGDRQQMEMATSPHFKFSSDQTAYRFTERVDGQPWLQSAITPKNGSNTLSPFVALATRS